MKNYNDLLAQNKRIYDQCWDDARNGKECASMRYVVARKAVFKYIKNIAIAMGKILPDYEPDWKYQSFFGTFEQMNKKYPRSIYAGF